MVNRKFFRKGNLPIRVTLVGFYCLLMAIIFYSPLAWDFLTQSDNGSEIYVSSYSDVVSEALFRKFEKETGIKVHTKYCDSDSEMWAQLYMNHGRGYDLITPTDYMVKIMREESLLRPIKTKKIEFFKDIDKRFVNLAGDPENKYSIPFAWSAHGLGYKKRYFERKGLSAPDSLAYALKPEQVFAKDIISKKLKNYRVCLVDEPLEIIFLASIFLFGDVKNFSTKNIEEIRNLLIAQRRWTRAYTNSDVSYYLAHCAPVVLALAAHAKKAMEGSSRFDFKIPKEGSLMLVQHLCIPNGAKNHKAARRLVDFLLRPDNQAEIFNQSGFAPVNNKANKFIDKKFSSNPSFFPPEEVFKKFRMLNSELSMKQAEELFFKVKTN